MCLEAPTEPYLPQSLVQITSLRPTYTPIQSCRPIFPHCNCKTSCAARISSSMAADGQIPSYLPSYPLVCLAAQYSQRAYNKPTGNEREAFVNADWRMGTKAMVIKSMPIDDMNCVVFAIRGSQTFMDWAVNLNSSPVSPNDFLVIPYARISKFQSLRNSRTIPATSAIQASYR